VIKSNESGEELGRCEEERPLRGDDNIKVCLNEAGWKRVDWIYLAVDRDNWRAVVNTVMNLRFE
jgi:hypothetical protein